MTQRDLSSNIAVSASIVPAVQAATVSGTAVDTAGYRSAAIIFSTGAIVGAGLFVPTVEESDDGATGWTTVAAADLNGTLPASLAASAAVRVGYAGYKRYIRAVGTKSSGTSLALGSTVVLGDPLIAPVA